MDKKLRETTHLGVEIMNSKRQVEESWSRGTNSRLPFDVNVMLNLSISDCALVSKKEWCTCDYRLHTAEAWL